MRWLSSAEITIDEVTKVTVDTMQASHSVRTTSYYMVNLVAVSHKHVTCLALADWIFIGGYPGLLAASPKNRGMEMDGETKKEFEEVYKRMLKQQETISKLVNVMRRFVAPDLMNTVGEIDRPRK